MSNELIEKKEGVVSLLESTELAEIIQPLVREIHLFDTWIAGTTHLKDPAPLQELKEGDRLVLKREDNRFDEKAIAIYSEAGSRLGYVPEKDNAVFSRLMDAGKLLAAKVLKIDRRGTFLRISISICLIDY